MTGKATPTQLLTGWSSHQIVSEKNTHDGLLITHVGLQRQSPSPRLLYRLH